MQNRVRCSRPRTARRVEPCLSGRLPAVNHAAIVDRFLARAPAHARCSIRIVESESERIAVRQDVVQPLHRDASIGAMVTVMAGGGLGYAATAELSDAGLTRAIERATHWATLSARRAVTHFEDIPLSVARGRYASVVRTPWSTIALNEKLDLLREQCARLALDKRIVDRSAWLWHAQKSTTLATTSGGYTEQHFTYLVPMLSATANAGAETQTRTLGGMAHVRQGGWETLAASGFLDQAPRIADDALALLAAPNCPSGVMDLILAPDQMVLQIHESIGHPLELDRILGDERNYAGTSFVTPDMFGSYQYGSHLLNVTFDPSRAEQAATYGFDDEGTPATREYLIRDGLLQRGLGGRTSQIRSGLPGVANARATDWNRPPIDRMANINLEPGSAALDTLIAGVENGVLMRTNRSWSIDDSRNKFQFGCEWAQRIERGRLTRVVKNANYRGISATFWRSLNGVGAPDTLEVLGTPYCGKGEPNQAIDVGHAAPPCRFSSVDVFGGA